jgi:hypothetical protein
MFVSAENRTPSVLKNGNVVVSDELSNGLASNISML